MFIHETAIRIFDKGVQFISIFELFFSSSVQKSKKKKVKNIIILIKTSKFLQLLVFFSSLILFTKMNFLFSNASCKLRLKAIFLDISPDLAKNETNRVVFNVSNALFYSFSFSLTFSTSLLVLQSFSCLYSLGISLACNMQHWLDFY